jgi:predicted phage-related endonuclease
MLTTNLRGEKSRDAGHKTIIKVVWACVMYQRWTITSEKEWLEKKKNGKYVTASNIGGLFNRHPYTSALRLYMEKSGIDLPPPASPVLRRGRILEPSVAAAVAEQRPEWRLEKCNAFYFDDEIGIGATPDFLIHGDPRGLGVLQTKTVKPFIFRRDWTATDPPFWIVLQTLTECMATGAAFGAVGALVVDPDELPCPIYDVPRHPGSEKRIVDAVVRFWKDVREGREPDANYAQDRSIMELLAPKEAAGTTVDLSADNEVISGLIERADLKKRIKKDEARCEEIEALVMDRMRDAAIAQVPDFGVTWKTTHFQTYTVAARDKRVLRIYDRRKNAEDEHA